ncbi:MAG: GerAB/ArcD/ProY family transporter [Christensenellales bacterium]
MNYLTKKQLSIMAFFIPLAFKMAMLPSLLYKECGADFYFAVGIITAIEFLQLAVILKVVDLGGFDGVEEKFGKTAKRILALPFLLSVFIKIIVFTAEIYYYTEQYLFYNISSAPIIISLCMVFFYMALKGAKTIGRIYELSIWLVPIIILLGIFFGKAELCSDYLLPVFSDGLKGMFDGLDKYIIYTFDFSPLLFFKIEKGKKTSVVFSAILCVIAVTASYMVFLASYGRASFLIPDAFARLASFNTVVSEIGSLDWPSALLWLTVTIANVALKFCCIGRLGSFFGIKKQVSLAATAIATGAILLFVLETYKKTLELATNPVRYAVVAIEIVIPLIMLLLFSIKKQEASLEPQN